LLEIKGKKTQAQLKKYSGGDGKNQQHSSIV